MCRQISEEETWIYRSKSSKDFYLSVVRRRPTFLFLYMMVIFHTDQYCKSWDFKESGAEDLSILDFVIRYIPYSCCQTLQHWIFDGANDVPFAFASYQVSIVISTITSSSASLWNIPEVASVEVLSLTINLFKLDHVIWLCLVRKIVLMITWVLSWCHDSETLLNDDWWWSWWLW